MITNLIFYSDPGHGWLKVPKASIVRFGLEADISQYSYHYKDSVFLEEDCDAPRYMERLALRGIKANITSRSVECSSPIRRYERYSRSCLEKS